jgi:hypothetical protein
MSEGTGVTAWRKSVCSLADTACVEVARTLEGVAVRHSKDPDGPVLRYSRSEWVAFATGMKAGEFDDLV